MLARCRFTQIWCRTRLLVVVTPPAIGPICTAYSLNRCTRNTVMMCNFSALIWMTKSLQTGWHCTYLTSTHWHGNLAAFSWRCHFPTSNREFHAASPGASHWQPGRGAMDGRRGLRGDAEVCRLGHMTLSSLIQTFKKIRKTCLLFFFFFYFKWY